jgi:hypothetical protein
MLITDDLQQRWWGLEAKLVERFGKKPDVEAILFLIGIQETGFMQKVLGQSGYYTVEGKDEEGWPYFAQLKELPVMTMPEQENFLKDHILLYFEQQGL